MDTTTPTTPTTKTTKNHRVRWAAIGAAVAVTLGAGGLSIVNADTSPQGAATFVGTDPCRIFDTRDAPNRVNGFDTLGPGGKLTVTAVGDVGNCKAADGTAIPASATGLQLNVTAVRASAITHLAVYPGAGDPPNASNLNPYPGEPPAPNAVTVKLDGSNQFSVWNNQGDVDVLADVVGYFTDEFTITGDEVADSSLTKADLLDEPGAAYHATVHDVPVALGLGNTVVGSVQLDVPADGLAIVHADVIWSEATNGTNDVANCQIVKTGTAIGTDGPVLRLNDNDGDTGWWDQSSGHRTFEVSPSDNFGDGTTFNLVCSQLQGSTPIVSVYMTAQYVPTNRGPSGAPDHFTLNEHAGG